MRRYHRSRGWSCGVRIEVRLDGREPPGPSGRVGEAIPPRPPALPPPPAVPAAVARAAAAPAPAATAGALEATAGSFAGTAVAPAELPPELAVAGCAAAAG